MLDMLMTDTSNVRSASSRSAVPAFIRMVTARVASMLAFAPVPEMPSYAPAPVRTSAAGHSFAAMTRWLDDADVADVATCGAQGNPTAVKRIHPGRLGGVT